MQREDSVKTERTPSTTQGMPEATGSWEKGRNRNPPTASIGTQLGLP